MSKRRLVDTNLIVRFSYRIMKSMPRPPEGFSMPVTAATW